MKHDKKSFLAGLSVGVSLRGWAAYDSGRAIIDSISIKTVRMPKIPPIVPVSAVAAGIPGGAVTIPQVPVPVFVYSFEEVTA